MISAIILTHNEEDNIKKCLNSVKWCDELIVIDDESSDSTAKIAEKSGASVYVRPLNNDFSKQRNFGLQKAKGEWVLFVDADEVISSALWFEIMQHTNSPSENNSGYLIKRQDKVWDRVLTHGETGNAKFLRLAKKSPGQWVGTVHETWEVPGTKITLNNPIIHNPHMTVKKFLNEINFYTDIRARELYDKKIHTFWFLIILFPLAKFVKNYIIKLGFRDGIPGLLLALMMTFHSFLVRSKLWLLWQKNK